MSSLYLNGNTFNLKSTLFFFQENGSFSALPLSSVVLLSFNFPLHLELIFISPPLTIQIAHLNFSSFLKGLFSNGKQDMARSGLNTVLPNGDDDLLGWQQLPLDVNLCDSTDRVGVTALWATKRLSVAFLRMPSSTHVFQTPAHYSRSPAVPHFALYP